MKLLSIPAALLVALIALAGCSSSGGGDDGGAAQSDAQAPAEAPAEEGDGAEAQFDVAEQRELIYTATLDALDEDPIAVAERAWAATEDFGGIVTADERNGSGEWSTVTLTLRIPSEHFAAAMDELAGLAEEETGRTVDTEDVTGQATDLEDTIATKSASLERVRGLLEGASSVEEILELETELSDREAELASLESQLAALQESIAMSTITYTVTTPEEERQEEEGYTGPGNFLEGLGAGWSGLVDFLRVVSVVVGVLLPFVPLVAVVLAAVLAPLWYARRRRNRAAAEAVR
ncbi:DUF4349 domain-containing protein [Glycomyces tenuis]|uniref:DUF4349 domain-containing protein n=1 Tax=Glycomyces tenuis TaxID=58116 RepID=UPI0003F9AA6C|nr:DUF4349 domain-containing protein [Glycomyces tenuis]